MFSVLAPKRPHSTLQREQRFASRQNIRAHARGIGSYMISFGRALGGVVRIGRRVPLILGTLEQLVDAPVQCHADTGNRGQTGRGGLHAGDVTELRADTGDHDQQDTERWQPSTCSLDEAVITCIGEK